ncbi:MAG: universal stress protein [Candidatus Bathyarchaeia archaeon]
MLVPIDGSEPSEDALFFALDLAEKFDSRVKILNVVADVETPFAPYPTVDSTTSPIWVEEYLERIEEKNKEMLEKHLEKARDRNPDLDISTELKEGRPADIILETAEEDDYNLIVMGSRGLGFVEEVVLGSVSREVVEKSKMPVLIVK